jgi:hypothetical protein
MALTNKIWGTPVNPAINQAATDVRPLGVDDRGAHVVILKNALAKVGYERGLDEMEFFGPYTHTIIMDFQDLYNLPKTGIVGKQTLETIDNLLNGVLVAKNPARTVAAANSEVGANFARLHIAQTKNWVQKSWQKCTTAYQEFWQGNEVEFDTALALLFHFRIITTDFSQIYSLSLGNKKKQFLDGMKTENRYKVVQRIRAIKAIYSNMLQNLNVKNGSNFIDYVVPAPPAKDPRAKSLAWAKVETKEIYFHPKLFFAQTPANPAGKDVRSASWVVVHELAHLMIGEDSFHTYIESTTIPVNNSYSSNSQYYRDGPEECVKNPDSYAHFAYQIVFGKPNVGPY